MGRPGKRGLGRIAPRDRDNDEQFLMRRALGAPGTPLPTRRSWRIGSTALHQGDTHTCVGHAWRNFLRCAPLQTEKAGPSSFDIYRKAVIVDEFRSNDDESRLPDGDPGLASGTTVRAGAKAVMEFGRLKSFLWAFALQPGVEWVLTKGPVVLGTDWWSSFFQPDDENIVHLKANASIAGGHAYLWRGVDMKRGLALCTNSWGDEWGKSGDFYIPLRDLERLISDNGEACTAVEKRWTAKSVTPPRQSTPQLAAAV
jgi:hypothetical protein